MTIAIVAWSAAATAQVSKVQLITRPDWVKKPTGDDIVQLWPAAPAAAHGGRSIIQCSVSAVGLLYNCKVLQESPAGSGFGLAAIAAANLFQMKPRAVDGSPVEGGTVRIPINWEGDMSGATKGLTTLVNPIWLKGPTRAEVAATGLTSGLAVLNCSLTASGTPRSCTVTRREGSFAVDRAALRLTSKFVTPPPTDPKTPLSDFRVNVVIGFDSPDYVETVTWLAGPTHDQVVGKLGPLSRNALGGIAKGTADCLIGPDGGLTDCHGIDETTAGAGKAVAELAPNFKAAAWTRDGHPSVGSRLRLPIKYVAESRGAPDAAAQAPAPQPQP